jgi:hypothetical protein
MGGGKRRDADPRLRPARRHPRPRWRRVGVGGAGSRSRYRARRSGRGWTDRRRGRVGTRTG